MRAFGRAIILTVIFAGLCTGLLAQTNPVPFICNPLVPSVVLPGAQGFTITVNGAGFVQGSVVKWSGSARATTFVSPTKLTAAILASDIATARTVLVTVSNPIPGGGTSDAVSFEVTTFTTTLSLTRRDVGSSSLINQPVGMTEGDFNRNGIPDLAVANHRCPPSRVCVLSPSDIAILLESFPSATEPITGPSPVSIAKGDFNGDGFLDLITINEARASAGPTISTLLGNGDGTFRAHADNPIPGGLGPGIVATGDFNRDGNLDLVMTNPSGISILLGNGDGTFGMSTSYNTGNLPFFVAVGDFNGDGKLDLAVSDAMANTISILLGNGDGTFQPLVDYSAGPFPVNILVTDFNHDGKADLAVLDNNSKISIYLGNGDGPFQPKVDYPAGTTNTSLATGDFNGDGIPDLAASDSLCTVPPCPANGSVNVFLGNGDGTFQSHLDFATGGDPISIAVDEFDLQPVGRSGFATLNFQDNTVSIFDPVSTGGGNSLSTISSISPTSEQMGSGSFALTVNGTNFVNGASVLFGATARPTTFVSSTQLTAAISADDISTAGIFFVSAMNPAPGGGSSTSIAFNVFLPPPTISSLSPSSVVAGGPSFTLAVNGSNFVIGAIVNVNGLPRNAAFVSISQVTIPISMSDIANQGIMTISVTDPLGPGSAGGTSPSATLTILATNTQPVIGALVPASATAGGPAFTLILTGTGFTSSSVVTFKSGKVSAAFVNSTQLQAPIPAIAIAIAGTPFVTVTNPGGSPSLVTTFTVNNPVPAASSLSPTTVSAGNAGVTLTVTGTNFNSSSTALVGGSPRATNVSSSTLLTATLPSSDFAHSGSLNIVVNNPAPGGGPTSALTILVEDFRISVPTSILSVVAGSPANFNVTITPSNGTTANPVMLAVSGVPIGATATFSPIAIVPAGSGVTTVMLSIATTAHSAATPFKSPRTPWRYLLTLYLVAGMVIVLMWLGRRLYPQRASQLAPQLLLVFLLAIVGGLIACGGVTGSAAPAVNRSTGTAAGMYSIVVTATSGGGSLSTTISLTVQ
jgi:hypothetical protein